MIAEEVLGTPHITSLTGAMAGVIMLTAVPFMLTVDATPLLFASQVAFANVTAERMLPARPFNEAKRACPDKLVNFGKAIAAMMARMIITATISIKVKPD